MNPMKSIQLTIIVKSALAFSIAAPAPSFAKDAQQNAIVAKGTNVVCEALAPYQDLGIAPYAGLRCQIKSGIKAADGKTEIIEPGSVFYGKVGEHGNINWYRVISTRGLMVGELNNDRPEILATSVIEDLPGAVNHFILHFERHLDFSLFREAQNAVYKKLVR